MEMLISVGLLIIGFVLLIKGADFFVDGSSSIAKILKVPSLIVGLTIVAMGTSLPECSVSIIASVNNNNSLAISNAIGSNIFNLMVVCGACSLFVPLEVAKSTIKRDFPFSIFCALVLGILGLTGMKIVRIEGIVLLVGFTVFMLLMVYSALASRKNGSEEKIEEEKNKPIWQCILLIIIGIVAIKFGGDAVVNGAVDIATRIGITETVIGLTIVSMGTSLPELVTSIVAARKNEIDMAVGNVLGSNIFNILFVLGIAASINDVSFIMENMWDIIIVIVFSIYAWIISIKKKKLTRSNGIIMLTLYGAYMIYIFVR